MNLHFDHYYTHAPLLAKCVANTTGPILELGTGVYSTSLLDCLAGSRTVVSTDSNLDFLSELKTQFESPTHKFVHIDADSAIKYNACDFQILLELIIGFMNPRGYDSKIFLIQAQSPQGASKIFLILFPLKNFCNSEIKLFV